MSWAALVASGDRTSDTQAATLSKTFARAVLRRKMGGDAPRRTTTRPAWRPTPRVTHTVMPGLDPGIHHFPCGKCKMARIGDLDSYIKTDIIAT